MRLIDADALLHNVRRAFYPSDLATRIAVGCVNGMPTVDAEPVRHGRWLEDDLFKGVFRCDRCRAGAPITFEYRRNELTNYCPNCGARMDGEDDADN